MCLEEQSLLVLSIRSPSGAARDRRAQCALIASRSLVNNTCIESHNMFKAMIQCRANVKSELAGSEMLHFKRNGSVVLTYESVRLHEAHVIIELGANAKLASLDYPCRCLCFGLVQITLTTPRR